jgi:hypothetical protein
MKLLLVLMSITICSVIKSQEAFDKAEYFDYLKNNDGLTYQQVEGSYSLKNDYYMFNDSSMNISNYAYLDSLVIKYGLTNDELSLLAKNGFVVTERKNFVSFLHALDNIYTNDMPVFVTSDAILFALHASYDNILKESEISILESNLTQALENMYYGFSTLELLYGIIPEMRKSLDDVDLYLTVALSLIKGDTTIQPHACSNESVKEILKYIRNYSVVDLALFSETERTIDFSQFKPRGHYLDGSMHTLENYFKTMMWLGRIDIWLTGPTNDSISLVNLKRANIDALLINELLDLSDSRSLLDENDTIISFLVGKCDNLTPTQLKQLQDKMSVKKATDLLNDTVLYRWVDTLAATPKFAQQIMSDIIMCDPFTDKPQPLPVSFRLMGQRFVIDSYVFANVVYDRIINNGEKVFRMMPSPLDAMFALGNNCALPLLKDEIEKYKYSLQLTGLRKLIDGYDDEFWGQTLYNSWLNSIREFNKPVDTVHVPNFMTTVAWQHEKLNTQLSSWAQLRHDNILYVKQSYTGGAICSYPYSYVEPYPALYRGIKNFSDKANAFYKNYSLRISLTNYFTTLSSVMDKLANISDKELNNKALTADEVTFLKSMIKLNDGHMCGMSPYSGWYYDILYGPTYEENVIADVHTQPTDEARNMVGKVLHVATGPINLGIFTCNAPLPDGRPMAFAGPVMSYYELITDNFLRHTDLEWQNIIASKNEPARPDWTNIYLAGKNGNVLPKGRELVYSLKTRTAIEAKQNAISTNFQLFPNPSKYYTNVIFESKSGSTVNLTISDQLGRIILSQKASSKVGKNSIEIDTYNLKPGIYIISCKTDDILLKKVLIKQ